MGIAEKSIKKKNNKIKEANIDVELYKVSKGYTLVITIDQLIEPQMRPRTGGYFNIYDPLSGYKKKIRKKVEQKLLEKKILIPINEEIYIHSRIDLVKEPPKSFSKYKKYQCLLGNIQFNKKPDIDNCIKTVYDSLEGLIYLNDSQIISDTVIKYYGIKEKTKITLDIFQHNDKYLKGKLTKEQINNMPNDIKEYLYGKDCTKND